MRLIFAVVLIFAIATIVVNGDQKSKVVKKCSNECPSDYTPICAQEGTDKGKSFGNKCVLEKFNCEHGSNLKEISKGECPGGGGVRLS